ncbi:hypothetical protein D3C86_775060 [compost metagenome]
MNTVQGHSEKNQRLKQKPLPMADGHGEQKWTEQMLFSLTELPDHTLHKKTISKTSTIPEQLL